MLSLILWLVFGAIIGWIAGVIMKDQRGILGNIIIGILGSFLGGWISTMTVGTSFNEFSLTGLIFSVIGAVILIFLKQLLMGKRS